MDVDMLRRMELEIITCLRKDVRSSRRAIETRVESTSVFNRDLEDDELKMKNARR